MAGYDNGFEVAGKQTVFLSWETIFMQNYKQESILQVIHFLHGHSEHMQRNFPLTHQNHHWGQCQKFHYRRKRDNHISHKTLCIASL